MRYFLEMVDKSSEIAGLQNLKYVQFSKSLKRSLVSAKYIRHILANKGIVISELLKFIG
jgi:hypothetical protein